MAENTAKAEENAPGVCSVCERESPHTTEWHAPDNTVSRVCWSCLQRREKRVNLNGRWKRGRRDTTHAR